MKRKRPQIVQRLPHAPNRLVWRKEWVGWLGAQPDHRVARRLKVHPGTVQEERQRRGIPPFRPRRADVVWTEEMIAFLGEATDAEVAAELGLGVGSVAMKRRILGIAPFGRSTRDRLASDPFWTKRRLALLGTAPDSELGRRWHIESQRVRYRRTVEGIAPFRPRPRRRPWRASETSWLGREADDKLARRLGRSAFDVSTERRRRGIPSFRAVGGKILRSTAVKRLLALPGHEAAALTGLSQSVVSRLRRLWNVPAPERRSAWTRAALSALGRVSDQTLAARLGLEVATVQKKRQKAGHKKRELRPWTAREDALVRSLPVREAARRARRTVKAVKHRRVVLGIGPEVRPSRWTPDVVALLGKFPDSEVARRICVTQTAVRIRRRKLGIGAAPSPKPLWTAREDELVRRHDESTASALTGRTLRAVQNRRRFLGVGSKNR